MCCLFSMDWMFFIGPILETMKKAWRWLETKKTKNKRQMYFMQQMAYVCTFECISILYYYYLWIPYFMFERQKNWIAWDLPIQYTIRHTTLQTNAMIVNQTRQSASSTILVLYIILVILWLQTTLLHALGESCYLLGHLFVDFWDRNSPHDWAIQKEYPWSRIALNGKKNF